MAIPATTRKDSSYDELVLLRGRLIAAVRRSLNLSQDDAEDLVHEALAIAYQKIADLDRVRNWVSYLMQTCKNLLFSERRRLRARRAVPIEVYSPDGDQQFDLTDPIAIMTHRKQEQQTDSADAVERALRSLKPEQAELIRKVDCEGYTLKELADQWGVKLGTMLGRHAAAKRNLRRVLLKEMADLYAELLLKQLEAIETEEAHGYEEWPGGLRRRFSYYRKGKSVKQEWSDGSVRAFDGHTYYDFDPRRNRCLVDTSAQEPNNPTIAEHRMFLDTFSRAILSRRKRGGPKLEFEDLGEEKTGATMTRHIRCVVTERTEGEPGKRVATQGLDLWVDTTQKEPVRLEVWMGPGRRKTLCVERFVCNPRIPGKSLRFEMPPSARKIDGAKVREDLRHEIDRRACGRTTFILRHVYLSKAGRLWIGISAVGSKREPLDGWLEPKERRHFWASVRPANGMPLIQCAQTRFGEVALREFMAYHPFVLARSEDAKRLAGTEIEIEISSVGWASEGAFGTRKGSYGVVFPNRTERIVVPKPSEDELPPYMRDAVDPRPGDGSVYRTYEDEKKRGIHWYHAGEMETAARHFENAVEMRKGEFDPGWQDTYRPWRALAKTYLSLEKRRKAKAVIEDCLSYFSTRSALELALEPMLQLAAESQIKLTGFDRGEASS